jgi:serine/threonine-protein kinase
LIEPGYRIGSYEVVRPLGRGGFGGTFLARHLLIGEKACLKFGHPDTDRRLLLHEAKVLWGCHHPSLPTLREVLETPEDGRIVLVMRFVEGTSMEKLRPMDLPTAFRVFGRILRALRVLHHRGIVHGDVKPANIIVEPDRHGAVLVDLGLATVRPDASTRPMGMTPTFAAPETLKRCPPLPESDLYSFGLTMAYVLGGNVENRVLPEGVPEDVLRFIVALSRKDPEHRPRWDTEDPMDWFDRLARKYGGS